MIDLRDLRCDGTRRAGPSAGQRCNYLLCRVAIRDGVIETKCPRCNKTRAWQFQMAAVST